MFGIFQNPIEKKTSIAAQHFFSGLSRWEHVIGPKELATWLGVNKNQSFASVLNLCFMLIQIYEGLRMLNKVAPTEYGNFFGKKIGALMQQHNKNSLEIFSNLSEYITTDTRRLFNPTEPIARWFLLNALQISTPSEKQLIEVGINVRVASESALDLLTNACPDFRFPHELLIKKFDTESSISTHVIQNGLIGKH